MFLRTWAIQLAYNYDGHFHFKLNYFVTVADASTASKKISKLVTKKLTKTHPKKFKRSSDREYDPWQFISADKFDKINESITRLNNTLYQVHGITLPENYIRQPLLEDL